MLFVPLLLIHNGYTLWIIYHYMTYLSLWPLERQMRTMYKIGLGYTISICVLVLNTAMHVRWQFITGVVNLLIHSSIMASIFFLIIFTPTHTRGSRYVAESV